MRRSVWAGPLALAVLALAALAAGCSSQTFVGQRVDNFSAYYNTFYNAKKAYGEGTALLSEISAPIRQDAYLSVFPSPEQAGGGDAFEKAIQKSADLLREHPNSKWVDDALMLIGQSYFYQQNFVGAEQKFREVLAQGGVHEEEARLWLSRTLVQAGNEAEAEALLQEALEGNGAGDRWAARLWLVQGELSVRQEDWEAAAAALRRGLEAGVGDGRLAARASFLLGQVLETTGQLREAAKAYDRAASKSAGYELKYAARVGVIRTRAETGAPDEALRALREMERDDKNRDHAGQLALLRGRILTMNGQPEAARQAYTDLLYGGAGDVDAGASGEVRGQAHYALGTLFRDEYGAYVRAAAHFDTAATALRAPAPAEDGVDAPRMPTAVTDAQEQSEVFGRLASASRAVGRLDSLLRLGRMSDADFDAFVEDLRRRLAREQAAARQAQQSRMQQQRFGDAGGFEGGSGAFGADGQEAAAAPAAQTASGEAGFLFHRDRARILQNRENFIERWGRRPRVPNWRRISAISGASSTQAAGSPTEEAGTGALDLAQPEGTVLPALDLDAVPRTPAALEQMEADRAVARYELANALFLSAGQPDSALVWYRRVIDEDSDQPVARRAYYALAEAQQAAGDTVAARQRYREVILRYPDTDLARRAQERLEETARSEAPGAAPLGRGAFPVEAARSEERSGAMPGREAQAERAYEQAYAQWQQQQYSEALRGMIETAAAYQGTDAAARALLAAGSVYIEWTRHDTLSLADPLPMSLPDSLTRAGGLLDASAADAVRSGPPSPTASDTAASSAGTGPEVGAQTLLASVATHYAQTPYAERARQMLRALEEYTPRRTEVGTLAAAPETAAPEASTSEEAVATEAEDEETPDASSAVPRSAQAAAQGGQRDSTQQVPAPDQIQAERPPVQQPSDAPELSDALGPTDSLHQEEPQAGADLAAPADTSAVDTSAAAEIAAVEIAAAEPDAMAKDSVAEGVAAEQAEEPPMGTLRVQVEPWGNIYVDGELRGKELDVRTILPLTAGSHQLTVSHPVLGTWEKTVRIVAREEAVVSVDFTSPTAERAASGLPSDSAAPDSVAVDLAAADPAVPDSTAEDSVAPSLAAADSIAPDLAAADPAAADSVIATFDSVTAADSAMEADPAADSVLADGAPPRAVAALDSAATSGADEPALSDRAEFLRPLRESPVPEWAQGNWVIVTASRADQDVAVEYAQVLRNMLGQVEHRVGLMRASVEGLTYFRVIVGPFASRQDALEALGEDDRLPVDAWVTRAE